MGILAKTLDWLLQRLALNDHGIAFLDEAVARKRVSDLLIDYRCLCYDIGFWQYAADLGAAVEVTTREVAYLAVWRDGPTLSVWEDVVRLDAVDLLIDAAVEGFEDALADEYAEA